MYDDDNGIVSEYYLSRHRHIPQKIPNDANLVIISDDPGFASNVTEMTLFIMMMSFTQGEKTRGDVLHIRISLPDPNKSDVILISTCLVMVGGPKNVYILDYTPLIPVKISSKDKQKMYIFGKRGNSHSSYTSMHFTLFSFWMVTL